MRLGERLSKVEAYGFDREVFPFRYNGHKIHLLHNNSHETADERLSIHFTVYCERCGRDETIRGKSKRDTQFERRHLQDVKIAVLGEFVRNACV